MSDLTPDRHICVFLYQVDLYTDSDEGLISMNN